MLSVLDLANKGVANLSNCGLFVMDEADKLLSPEFQPLIEQVINFLPAERQILLFSATFPITGIIQLLTSLWQTVLCFFSEGVPWQVPKEALRDQPDGAVDPEGCLTVLCVCWGTSEDSLPEHPVLQGVTVKVKLQNIFIFLPAPNQSVNYLLQLCQPSWAAG